MTDISVLIPTYNRAWAIEDAVRSCLGDTVASTEVIVVDDGSTDDTLAKLSKLSQVRVVRQRNEGKAYAVNRAFAMASGTYVRFLDSDDYLCEGANDRQWEVARETGVDVVCGGLIEVHDATGQKIPRPWVDCDDFIAQQLGECDSSHYSAYLFRKEFIHDVAHRPEYSVIDDRVFCLEVAMKHPKVAHVTEPVLFHRHHSQARVQGGGGLRRALAHLQMLNAHRMTRRRLAEQGDLTPRRVAASVGILRHHVHWVAMTDVDDAVALREELRTLGLDRFVTGRREIDLLVSLVGLARAEHLLSIWRHARGLLRASSASR